MTPLSTEGTADGHGTQTLFEIAGWCSQILASDFGVGRGFWPCELQTIIFGKFDWRQKLQEGAIIALWTPGPGVL